MSHKKQHIKESKVAVISKKAQSLGYCCRKVIEAWAATLTEQRHLFNALKLWKRFNDKNVADLVKLTSKKVPMHTTKT